MDQPVSEKEVFKAIKKVKSNKALGRDVFPIKFSKTFADYLIPIMKDVYDPVMMEDNIPASWNEATLQPMLKLGKVAMLCPSYRPPSLLNIDAKIFTLVLSSWFQQIITQYINPHQSSFIPTRSMNYNIRQTLNIICYGKSKQVSSLLLALDFEKAFDSVELDYINLLLWNMNFGKQFMKSIDVLYNHPRDRIKINYSKSRYVPIGSGTRKGCPLFPLLFALCTM